MCICKYIPGCIVVNREGIPAGVVVVDDGEHSKLTFNPKISDPYFG